LGIKLNILKRVYSFGLLIIKELYQKAAYWISDRILELTSSTNFINKDTLSYVFVITKQKKLRV